jgi:hypothetical protein
MWLVSPKSVYHYPSATELAVRAALRYSADESSSYLYQQVLVEWLIFRHHGHWGRGGATVGASQPRDLVGEATTGAVTAPTAACRAMDWTTRLPTTR